MTTAHRGLIGIAGLFWGLQGCFNPAPPVGTTCAPDGWCPSGQYCDLSTFLCMPSDGLDAAQPWWPDGGTPWPPFDAAEPWPDAGPLVGIEAALNSYGPVDILIPDVLITYVKPGNDYEPPGFFVQENSEGPALFVGGEVDRVGARLAVGDRISFRIGNMLYLYDTPMAESISDIVIHARGEDTSALVQDVTNTTYVAYSAHLYTSELVSVAFLIDGTFMPDGLGFVTATISTDSVYGEPWFRVRVPEDLQQDVLGLEPGCMVHLQATPVWRYYEQVQFLIQDTSVYWGVFCPETDIVSATAESATELRLELSRAIDPATVAPDGSQFTFDGGLQATSAVVSGRFITVTTTPQNEGQRYAIAIKHDLQDVFGRSVRDAGWSFTGERSRPLVRINEIKLNIEPGCDLVELRAVTAGSLAEYNLRSQTTTVLSFSNLVVNPGDLVVVHFDGNDGSCRRNGSVNELTSPAEQPRSEFPANFDTAYDWYTNFQGPAHTPGVLALRDDQDRILDAILFKDSTSTYTAVPTESAAELVSLAGEWVTPAGTVPPGGFVEAAFLDNAVPGADIDEVNVAIGGFDELEGARSIQRRDNADSNHAGDWTTAVQTFGVANTGQSPF